MQEHPGAMVISKLNAIELIHAGAYIPPSIVQSLEI